MRTVSEVIMDLAGNGFSEKDLITLSSNLTQLADAKNKICEQLNDVLEREEIDEILLDVQRPSRQQLIASLAIDCLAPKEKKYYLMHTVENMSMGKIAKECDVSKGTVQETIERARKKINMIKEHRRFKREGNVRFLPEKE